MLSLILEENVEKLYKVYLLIYDNGHLEAGGLSYMSRLVRGKTASY
jgi:hypothetical protein